ncbi:hypothetical protein Caci_8490 [Catenulispora acidiphila DSM 44928]|uniref:Uncharacterized protein n=2 Tax=Catenulispora TaxID=414878 RepID=C7PYJ1_CATAD|nr:hypothetical protein Caci_8490 [Catenulispora acidiphila DSM 44928]
MLRVMLRRWYVSIPALIVAVALPAAAWTMISSKYLSTSTISLLNSTAASSANQRTGNPFLAFDSSLTPMADFLARRLGSDQSAADLAARGVVDPASAVLAPNASGPFLTMTVTGKDQALVLTELQTFDQYAIEQLAVIQTTTTASLPPSTLIRAVVVVPPQKPTTSMKSKFEDVAGAGVFGLAILFLAVFGSESLALRRARARAGLPRRHDTGGAASPGGGRGGREARAGRTDTGADEPAALGSGAGTGTLARRAPALSSAAQLPRYRDPEFDPEDEDEHEHETEPWIDVEPLPLEHLAVTDRDPGSR